MKKFFSLLFLIPVVYSCTIAQEAGDKYASLITLESSQKHLSLLASAEFEGRGTGQEGGRKAANYIAEQFKSYGLQPVVNGSYFQPVSLRRIGYEADDLVIGDNTYQYGKDFLVQGNNEFENFLSHEVVFVGYGIQDKKYNDLDHIDIKGKIVLVISEDEPKDASGNSIISGTSRLSDWSTSRFKRIQELSKLEPALILTASSESAAYIDRMKARLSTGQIALDLTKSGNRTVTQPIPVVTIGEHIADKILSQIGSSVANFKRQANTTHKPQSASVSIAVNTAMGIKEEKLNDPNVMGLVEGTDLKDEVVVVIGHYDHDGIAPDGTIFYGADDNGSGTVAVLELARVFAQAKKDGNSPRRSVLFIALAAEEKGLLGSKYYVEHPVLPLESTVACINIDMIGRIDNKHLNGNHNYIHVIGATKLSSDLKPIVEAANKSIGMKLDYDYDQPNEPLRLYYRSDHYNFAQKGIPSLFFFSGLHPHYHTPEDTVDKINFPMMVKREKLIFNTTWDIANRDKKPIVDIKEDTGSR